MEQVVSAIVPFIMGLGYKSRCRNVIRSDRVGPPA